LSIKDNKLTFSETLNISERYEATSFPFSSVKEDSAIFAFIVYENSGTFSTFEEPRVVTTSLKSLAFFTSLSIASLIQKNTEIMIQGWAAKLTHLASHRNRVVKYFETNGSLYSI
jgi:hypothetical protein